MKRLVAILLVLGCAGGLFALDMSAGVGGNFTAAFDTYILKDMDKLSDYWGDHNPNTHLLGGGFFAFFDITYLEANVGLLFGNFRSDNTSNNSDGIDLTFLKLSLFGKYPFTMSSFTLFPMLGIDGAILLKASWNGYADENRDRLKDSDQFWFKGGVGADIPMPALDGKLFIRPEFLYGIRLNTKNENDEIKSDGFKDTFLGIIGHGLDIRFLVGYKF